MGSLGPYFRRPAKAPQARDACPLYDAHSEHVEEANTSIGHPPVLPSKIGSQLPNGCQREGMLGCTMHGLLPEPSSVTLIHEPTHHLGSFEDPLGVHVKGGSEGTVHPTTHHHGHPFQCCSRHAGTHSSIDISHDFSVLPCVTSWRSREMRLLVDVSEWPEAQLRIGRWLAYEPRHKRHPSLEAAI